MVNPVRQIQNGLSAFLFEPYNLRICPASLLNSFEEVRTIYGRNMPTLSKFIINKWLLSKFTEYYSGKAHEFNGPFTPGVSTCMYARVLHPMVSHLIDET